MSDAITILAERTDVVAVLKTEGTATVPEGAEDEGCLSARLAAQLGRRVYPVHRLDKDVSGVVLFALTAEMHRHLNAAFEHRLVTKTYLALVLNRAHFDRRVIDAPVHAFASGRMGVDSERGKPSVTDVAVLQAIPGFTLVRCWPLTGRRHQIRVHLYHIGHPIAGDRRYGDRNRAAVLPRLMLHAESIDAPLPDGTRLAVSCRSASFDQAAEEIGFRRDKVS